MKLLTTPEPITIRRATAADLGSIVLSNLSMAEKLRLALDPATLRRGVHTILKDPGLGRYYLFARDGAPTGQVSLVREWDDWLDGHVLRLDNLHSAEEGNGVGSALVRHAQDLARSTPGNAGIRLEVPDGDSSSRLLRFYGKLGFVPTGTAMEWIIRGR